MNPGAYGLSKVRDERTFKYKDDTLKRVVSREGHPQWFIMRDYWTELNRGKSDEMESIFLAWKNRITLEVRLNDSPTRSQMLASR